MATLKAMFKLFDGYSRTADVIEKKTKKATDKILDASGATDKFNDKLVATGVSANKASSGLGKMVKAVISLAAAKKGADITDQYTNTLARLDLINDGLQTRLELESKIFAAADRSRGAYKDMANAISKMGLLAGDAFTSNDELIAFTELVQKSFKVSGADTSEQQGAMRQLSQAMASGRLQGDELVSIMENAPMVYEAISKYMGKSKGELKKLSSEGVITSDIIKNAIFMAADNINTKFEAMPKNFGDVWNKIVNGATRKFAPLMQKVNKIINSTKFDKFTDSLVDGFGVVANVAGKALDAIGSIYNLVANNWDKLRPIIEGVTAAWLAYKGAMILVEAAQWAVNLAMAANPIGIVIVLIGALVAAIVYLWETSEGFRKFWADMWSNNMRNTAEAYNAIVPIYNGLLDAYDWMIDKMVEFDGAVRDIWIGIVKAIANGIKGLISNFDFLVDKLNGFIPIYNKIAEMTGQKKVDVEFSTSDIISGIDKIVSQYESDLMANGSDYALGLNKYKKVRLEKIDMDRFNKNVDEFSEKIENFTISGWLGGLFDEAAKKIEVGLEDYDLLKDVVPIEGTGSGGAVKVDMSDEDLRYLRDIAERDYINKFTTATLAPNVSIQFGDVHETADADKVAGRIKQILQEEIAMTAEGAYA